MLDDRRRACQISTVADAGIRASRGFQRTPWCFQRRSIMPPPRRMWDVGRRGGLTACDGPKSRWTMGVAPTNTEDRGGTLFARSVGSGCPNRSRLCEGECGQWLRWKKSLRHEPVKTRPGEENGPGSEEAPVRSGRCPPFQGRIFPPSSPGEKVAPLNRSVAAKNVWCGLAVVVVDRWHSALSPLKTALKMGPAGSRWGPVTFPSWSLVAHKIPAAPGLHISLDVSPSVAAVWLPAPPRLACTP